MAAKAKRTAHKTNVYWSKDPDDEDERIVKVHVPGVILEPNPNVKNPMVRKPVHMMKPKVVTLQTSLRNSLEKRRQELSRSDTSASQSKDKADSLLPHCEGSFGQIHHRVKDNSKKEVTLKELNPQDKKRVANLVKELARVGEERQQADERLQAERLAFEERLVILQEEYDAVIKEKIYLQKRFVELQALLVKYQTQGRTPSPRKAVKSPVSGSGQQGQVDSSIHVLSPASPSKPASLSPSKPTSVQVPGNTRPVLTAVSGDKLNVSGLRASLLRPGTNGSTVALDNEDTKGVMDTTLKPGTPLHSNSLDASVAKTKESFPEILSSSQNGKTVLRASSRSAPAATSSQVEVTSQKHEIMEIPQSSVQKDGLGNKSLESVEISSRPAMHPGVAVTSQARALFSVFGDGVPEMKTDWKIPPSNNEDRPLSEASGVSGSFSAELDAVYRLYCREYELQLQLQQQQIELQKQQLQLQQQLQQVETLQQQQQQSQQQQQDQQHPSTQRHQSTNHVSSASQAMAGATHDKHLTTVIDETPTPSPVVPRPTSQPRQVSPARSLIPTPEGFSSVTTDGYQLPGAGVQRPVNMSTAGANMSSNTEQRNVDNRMEHGKENEDPLVPDPPGRVESAPPSLGHPRSNLKHRQVPRPQDESQTSADHSYRGRAVAAGYERHQVDDYPQHTQQNVDGRVSAEYHASRPLSSRNSLYSHSHDVSAKREMMALRERHDQAFNVRQDALSGRESKDLFHPWSNYDMMSEQASLGAESYQTDSILSGTRRTRPQSSFQEPHSSHSQIQRAFKRPASSDQRFSLYSDIGNGLQSRDHQLFPGGDDVMNFRHDTLEQSVERASFDTAYPLSLVDIVEDLEEHKIRDQDHYMFSTPGLAGGLDTTDSGYSQDTKERSPLTSDNVNSDDEEAAVLEDIFFLSGRL